MKVWAKAKAKAAVAPRAAQEEEEKPQEEEPVPVDETLPQFLERRRIEKRKAAEIAPDEEAKLDNALDNAV